MKKYILFLILFVFSLFVNSQTYDMDNTPVTTCTGNFYDDGGSAANYTNNKDFTKVFTPNVAGNKLRFVFTAWGIGDNQDFLYIYDGPTTAAPLIGTFGNVSGSPGTITATNATGQLTFRWISDNNGRDIGWAATISCITPPPAPINDDCSGAILLVANASCVYQTFTNVGATASSGVPAPGCASYAGGDVWFKFVAPASGCVNINTNVGGITDGGMALYSGPCATLVLVECDDDDSPNGMMPMIDQTGLTPGATYYIRFWEYGGDVFGTFDICVSSPCTGVPAGGTATANPASINCAPQSLTLTCTGMATTCVNYRWQSSPDNSTWTNIAGATSTTYTYTPVSSLYYRLRTTCSGGGSSGFSNSVLVPVSTSSYAPTCNLNYTVGTIAYNWANMGGGVEISIPADDRYSSNYIPIGFNFCYDGIQYTQLLVSSNSYVIFEAIGCATNEPTGNAVPGGWTDWEITMAIPNTTEAPRNCIMIPWQDSDPNNGGTLSYKLFGSSPNRIFVVEYNNVAMYSSSCTAYSFSGQVKLFETTNNIEIHLKNKEVCAAWNSGAAILGLHNYNGTIAVVPAGYNFPTQWSATNEAWRFTCNCPTCTNPLPITLIDFSAKCNNGSNIIKWRTASEQNTDYFIIKKSLDGSNFTVFETVKAAGNSNEIIEYKVMDNSGDPLTYYQLVEYDYDGASKSFGIISSRCSEKESFTVHPNPSKPGDCIIIGGDVYSVTITDASGKKIDAKVEGNKITGLVSGMYILTVNGYHKVKLIVN